MREDDSLHREYLAFLGEHGLEPSEPLTLTRDLYLQAMDESEGRFPKSSGSQLKKLLLRHFDRTQADKQPINYNHAIIRELSGEIEEAIRKSEYRDRFGDLHIYAGEFPTGDINALATTAPSGFLALINVGLVRFLESAVYLLLGAPLSNDATGKRVIDKDAATLMTSVLLTYILQCEPLRTKVDTSKKFRFDMNRAVHYSLFKNSCLRFALAHEYGHVLAGHLHESSLRQRRIITQAGEIEVLAKSWNEEYEADFIALKILLGSADYSLTPRNNEEAAETLLRGYHLASPFFFFGLESLLRAVSNLMFGRKVVEQQAGETLATSHPPPQKRMEALHGYIETIIPKGHPVYLPLAQSAEWLHAIIQEVLASVKDFWKEVSWSR